MGRERYAIRRIIFNKKLPIHVFGMGGFGLTETGNLTIFTELQLCFFKRLMR